MAVNFTLEEVKEKLRDRVALYKQPKQWLAVPELPRNAQGKINRTEVKKLAIARLSRSRD